MKPLFFCLLLAATLGACKKQPAECPQLTRAPQAFLDYWYFPMGSTWVYRLRGSSPAVYDTLRVTNQGEDHLTQPQGGDPRSPCVVGYGLGTTHSNRVYFPGTPGTPEPGIEIYRSNPVFYGQHWYVDQVSQVATLYPPEIAFGYPFRPGQQLLNQLSVADTAAVVTPAGTFHQSVHLIPDYGSKVDSTQFNWIRHLYRSRYVGITKIVYTNNQTWELLTYKIPR